MGMKGILVTRALVWLLVGAALFVSLMYQLPEERKTSKAERKAIKIMVSVVGIILIGTGIVISFLQFHRIWKLVILN